MLWMNAYRPDYDRDAGAWTLSFNTHLATSLLHEYGMDYGYPLVHIRSTFLKHVHQQRRDHAGHPIHTRIGYAILDTIEELQGYPEVFLHIFTNQHVRRSYPDPPEHREHR